MVGGAKVVTIDCRGRAAFRQQSTTTNYICKRPCRFSSLERIQKLEREAEELRNSLMEKLKVARRAEKAT